MSTKNAKQRTINDAPTERMPFFSIIVPVYNVALYLRECLDSVLAQTYPNWECLCVDDGSTDESGAILDEYAQKDTRFRIFHKKNGGVSAARNLALDSVKGEWIWFVDGDDAIRFDALEWLWRVIITHPQIDTIAFNVIHGVQMDNLKWKSLPPPATLIPTEKITSTSLSTHRQAVCTVVQRKSDLRFEPYSIGEDALFQVMAYFRNRLKVVISEPLYFYRYRVDSAVHSAPSPQKTHDLLSAEKRILQELLTHKDLWQCADITKFLQWKRHFVWITFQRMFFRLSNQDMQQLLPLWCEVQVLLFSLFKASFGQRLIYPIIKKTNSPFLCKCFIYYPHLIKLAIVKILKRLGLRKNA